MFAPADFLDLEHTAHPKLFENQNHVWDALKQIASYLQFRLKPAVFAELIGKPFISNRVFVGRGTVVEQGAVLKGPAWIGENCQIRSGCYVRENVIAGNCVLLGVITRATAAAFVTAGLISALVFPMLASSLLRSHLAVSADEDAPGAD